jgi:hypothetical protein
VFRSILVLESPWDSSSVRSTSVWPFVSEFAKVKEIDAYYQSFTDLESFKHWVKCFNKEKLRGPKMLYVAAHGTEGRIGGLKRDMNAPTIQATLARAKNIAHVHFGSCLYGTERNLQALLMKAKHLTSAAGYEKSVDWIDSALFDIMLWGRVVERDEDKKHARTHILIRDLLRPLVVSCGIPG